MSLPLEQLPLSNDSTLLLTNLILTSTKIPLLESTNSLLIGTHQSAGYLKSQQRRLKKESNTCTHLDHHRSPQLVKTSKDTSIKTTKTTTSTTKINTTIVAYSVPPSNARTASAFKTGTQVPQQHY
jgi:hypothetical protein